MENYVGSIDTDMAIGSILSNFETPWIMHTIQDSLNMKFRPYQEPMPNFVDILQRQFDAVLMASPDYTDQVLEVRKQTYQEIITAICEYYGLRFTKPFEDIHPVELYGIAQTMYDVFISRFTQYMIEFYIRYIIYNSDSIYAYLTDSIPPKRGSAKEKDQISKNYIDPKYLLIHQNLNTVILNMTTYDVPLDTLLKFFLDQNQAARMSELLEDTGDIYKNHYAVYLQDNRYMADVLTVVKLQLQSHTQDTSNYQLTKSEE